MAAKRARRGPGGRPPKRAADRLSEKVLVTFTVGQRRAVEKAAGKEPVAVFLRRLVLHYLNRAPAAPDA